MATDGKSYGWKRGLAIVLRSLTFYTSFQVEKGKGSGRVALGEHDYKKDSKLMSNVHIIS